MEFLYLSTCTVDVQLHVLLVLRVKIEHGSNQLISEFLINRLPEEDDSLSVLQT